LTAVDPTAEHVSYAIELGGFLAWVPVLLPLPWAASDLQHQVEAYQLDIDDDELTRAVVSCDKDFDWGDRSQETELHRYYGTPPYWGGF